MRSLLIASQEARNINISTYNVSGAGTHDEPLSLRGRLHETLSRNESECSRVNPVPSV